MQKGDFRKRLFLTLAIIAVALLFLAGTYLLVTTKKGTEKEASKNRNVPDKEEMPLEQANGQDPEHFLQEFAQVLFTYDTRERRFFEGAEMFMTPQAFAQLKPASAEESLESGEAFPAVISTLQEAKCYYSYFSESEAEVIMESHFTLNRSGNGQILQYIRLGIERQASGWKITGINVLDTLEQ